MGFFFRSLRLRRAHRRVARRRRVRRGARLGFGEFPFRRPRRFCRRASRARAPRRGGASSSIVPATLPDPEYRQQGPALGQHRDCERTE
jgi:hypothetical protein